VTTFEQCKAELEQIRSRSDDEEFHARFDALIQRRLAELDPEFESKMRGYYIESGMARWCA